jgi:hypothetical protein
MIPAGVNWAPKPRLWTGALRTRLRGSFGVASSEAATVLPAVGPSLATIFSNLLKKFIDTFSALRLKPLLHLELF